MKNKTNFLAIVFVGVVAIALAFTNEWITLEMFEKSFLAVTTGLGLIIALWKTLESEDKSKIIKEKDAEIFR